MAESQPRRAGDPPFLDPEPPPWAARGLATLLIALFAVALVAAVAVRVPETVTGRFTLVPVGGNDPVRALRGGQLVAVQAAEGTVVRQGAPLFVVRSDPVADRASELAQLETQLAGASAEEANWRREYEDHRRADEQEGASIEARIVALDRTIALKTRAHDLAAASAERFRAGYERGMISGEEYTAHQLEATQLAGEQASLEGDRAEAIASLARLRHEMDARAAAYRESLRRLAQQRDDARIRSAMLRPQLGQSAGTDLLVTAPCTGTVLRLRVRSPGAVVQEGEVLGGMACDGERLQAELALPQAGVARVRSGQAVKLLYDAFPYQRFGVRVGRVRWVTPATATATGAAPDDAFRALVDLQDRAIRVDGRLQDLLAGMEGSARVVVGRRSLVSYAFEPIRQLRESLADAEGGAR